MEDEKLIVLRVLELLRMFFFHIIVTSKKLFVMDILEMVSNIKILNLSEIFNNILEIVPIIVVCQAVIFVYINKLGEVRTMELGSMEKRFGVGCIFYPHKHLFKLVLEYIGM